MDISGVEVDCLWRRILGLWVIDYAGRQTQTRWDLRSSPYSSGFRYHGELPEGRKKAFHTCASHLTVVALCYGMAICTYIQPRSSPSVLQEKLISLFYAILTPMLNPMIYSLRNKEVKGAWQKLVGHLSGLRSKLAG
ncbi:Olfactory receptor-like protein OLF3 [Galemys pyrenaicus]|uniref:Olfactory receptor-like protein OLF3 n=1 Tax=Galemys pyrenaicus TaxID=202257 RepID=A0A8J6DNC7_GALPY|nr:Olfactory receptor-like protein OLF3 [Galemys pyrenaicus]